MIAIVPVGYNRPNSMHRLLESLCQADYVGDQVTLYISIDKGNKQQEIVEVAENFEWPYGEKIVRAFPKKQGLRKHILQCGDLTEEYDAVVVLEDDLQVSKAFYKYLKSAIEFYDRDERIAGISLYSYRVNEFNEMPFQAAYNGYDSFLMQVAQSWGQCWTKRMWSGFRNWALSDVEKLPEGTYMPSRIFHWGATSWKKNYMAYLTLENKYFVYPYFAYSNNMSEAGTHRDQDTADYQVLLVEDKNRWSFSPFEEAIKYDVFFERLEYPIVLPQYENANVLLDIYGLRSDYTGADVLISKNSLPYKLIREIGFKYRPHELNCSLLPEGKGLYVYDIHTSAKPPKQNRTDFLRYEYDVSGANWHFGLEYWIFGFCRALKRRVKRK